VLAITNGLDRMSTSPIVATRLAARHLGARGPPTPGEFPKFGEFVLGQKTHAARARSVALTEI
jgi:hypothetical protein